MKRYYFSASISLLLILVLFSLSNNALTQEKPTQIEDLMQRYYDYRLFNGTVLVAEGGKVIYRKGFGMADMEWNIPNTPDTKFRIGSITKQFTATLILQLMEEGKIKLDRKLSDCLPYYRKDTGEKVTIHHLLTHTSGIPSYTNLPQFYEEISRDPYPVEDFIEKYCSGDLEFEPGSKFSYNNSGYFILGAIIEKTTGKTYEEVLRKKILDPLGMKNTGYDHYDTLIPARAEGYEKRLDGYENAPYLDMSLPYAAGAMYSTVEDLYIWDQALYSEKVLSKKMKELMFKPHEKAMGGNYAYGWLITEISLPETEGKIISIAHGGGINGFNTLINRLVTDNHLIVLFNNTGGTNLRAMSDGIIRILYDKPYDYPKKPISEMLSKTIAEEDVKAAIEQYEDMKKNHPEEYNFEPRELNMLGYYLLQEMKNIKDAIEIFKLNVKAHPEDANAYDSLAEAYAKSGERELAIKNYAKSLELNPQNTNAIKKLNELIEKK